MIKVTNCLIYTWRIEREDLLYKRNSKGKYLFTNSEKEYMLKKYNSGVAIYRIAKEFGLGFNVVRNTITDAGLEIRGNDYYARVYTCDSDYFNKIDTEEKAYWLGFIYADGYITQRKQLGIALASRDREHLYKFRNAISSDYPIHEYPCTGFGEGGNYSRILVEDDQLWSDVQRKGVFLNKTTNIKFPNESQVPKSLIHHFIRGYWDGDGSLYESKSKYGYDKHMSVLGTKSFITEIQKFLGKENNKIHQRNKERNVDNWTLDIGGNTQVPKLLDKIYKNATVYLDRKYEIYKQFKT